MSTANPASLAPDLAPPGAGLPKPELMIARWIFGRMRRKTSRDEVCEMFESERGRALDLARSVDAAAGARPVLIKRPRGLEDSSRNWSIFMTLDHLRIVNLGMFDLAKSLGRGESPAGVVSTADLKPSPKVGPEMVDEFDRSCGLLVKAFAKISDLHTPTRHPHPWFGPLDAAGWHAMSAFHTRLHRKQIELILAGM